jgi:asparaginyl-tRNA synthetase
MVITIKKIFKNYKTLENKKITIQGWIKTNRSQKDLGFIMLNDGSCLSNIQIVYNNNLENFNEIAAFRTGVALTAIGILVLTPNAKQAFELNALNVIIEGDCSEDFPIQPKRHTREYLREMTYLRMRTNLFNAVFRVRSLLSFAIHQFFQNEDFIYVHTPIITGTDAEGAGEMFQVTTLDLKKVPLNENKEVDYTKDFFQKSVNLTVSGQLEVEPFALTYKKVYTFGPTFRAEQSNTMRHAAEFWMIEPEIAFATLEDDMKLAEKMLKYLVNYILKNAPEELSLFDQFVYPGKIKQLTDLVNSKIAICEYKDAITICQNSTKQFENKISFGSDLATEHEKYLTDEYFKSPVFVINWPKEIKAFYMKINKDNKTVAAMDLLVPGSGELIGGSQREDNYNVLYDRMKEMHIPLKEMQWYLNLRKYGGVKHAGFGLGFDRLIMYITGIENIRDTQPYPRTTKQLL